MDILFVYVHIQRDCNEWSKLDQFREKIVPFSKYVFVLNNYINITLQNLKVNLEICFIAEKVCFVLGVITSYIVN